MSKTSTTATSDFFDPDEAPPVTQEDLDRAVFRVGGKVVEKGKVRIAMVLDAAIVRYFKRKGGNRGYEALINKALGEYVRDHT